MRHIIIGGSAAGTAAAAAIKEAEPEAEVTLVRAESVSCCKPMLPHLLCGEVQEADCRLRQEDDLRAAGVEVAAGRTAVSVSAPSGRVAFSDGASLSFDRLLFATGTAPLPVEIPGANCRGVTPMSSLGDARLLRARLAGVGTGGAVVIGAGLVGLRTACALMRARVPVTVCEICEIVLPSVLDPVSAGVVRKHLEARGVRVLTGRRAEEIEGGPQGVSAVRLDGGDTLRCRAVVIAVGAAPEVKLALAAGAEVGRGVKVDLTMRTTLGGVYAAGDAAEAYDPAAGGLLCHADWFGAARQGRVAGLNMAGRRTEYEGGIAVNSAELLGLQVVSLGLASRSGEGFEVLDRAAPSGTRYRRFVLSNGKLAGAVFIGDCERAGIYGEIMLRRVDLGAAREDILQEGRLFMGLVDEMRKGELSGGVEWASGIGSAEPYAKRFDDEGWRRRIRKGT